MRVYSSEQTMVHQGTLVRTKLLQNALDMNRKINEKDYPGIPVNRDGKNDPKWFKSWTLTFMMQAQQDQVNDIFDDNVIPSHLLQPRSTVTDPKYLNNQNIISWMFKLYNLLVQL